VAVFVRHADKILLIKHKRLGTWLPPGGEIHPGETPLEAARRELLEETGLEGRFGPPSSIEGTPIGLIGYEEHEAGSKGLHMNFVFACDVETDRVQPNDEFSDHRWTADLAAIECPLNVRQLGRLALGIESEPPAARPLGHPTSSLFEIARAWLAAFNARDLDRLLALYAEDAVHTSPKLRARDPATHGEVRGKAALRAWWADAMARLPGLEYRAKHLTASGDRVFMEYERVSPGEPSFMVAEVLVVQAGHIARSHVYHG
jgi:8-oxo-dGTP diphosphatase